jgi:hypothetical protein
VHKSVMLLNVEAAHGTISHCDNCFMSMKLVDIRAKGKIFHVVLSY